MASTRTTSFFALPFLLLAAIRHAALRPLFIVLSLSAALNMNLFYGLGRGVGWALPRTATFLDTSVVLSFVNLGLLVWFARLVRRISHDTSTASPAS